MSKIAEYAINTYGMHIVLGLHSLPGELLPSTIFTSTDVRVVQVE